MLIIWTTRMFVGKPSHLIPTLYEACSVHSSLCDGYPCHNLGRYQSRHQHTHGYITSNHYIIGWSGRTRTYNISVNSRVQLPIVLQTKFYTNYEFTDANFVSSAPDTYCAASAAVAADVVFGISPISTVL